jgi:hypothetical protein
VFQKASLVLTAKLRKDESFWCMNVQVQMQTWWMQFSHAEAKESKEPLDSEEKGSFGQSKVHDIIIPYA